MAKTKNKGGSTPQTVTALAWHQSLETKLGFVFLLLLVLLTSGAYWANKVLVGDGLLDESQRYEEEVASRAAENLDNSAHHVRILAATLAQLAGEASITATSLRLTAPKLVAARPYGNLVAAFGIWPEPRAATAAGRERSALLWLRDGKGGFVLHEEMNADKSPYFHERWYTPGRYLGSGNCYWTGARRELISKEPVITCVSPIAAEAGFAGVVTVSIAMDTLAARLDSLQRDSGAYLLLLDQQGRMLAATGNTNAIFGSGDTGRTTAELVKDHPDYASLALTLHKQAESAAGAVVQSSSYEASSVSAIKDATRELSRQEAEDILITVWGSQRQGNRAQPQALQVQQARLAHDPVLGEEGNVSIFGSSEGAWQLLRVAPASSSFAGVSYVFMQALVVTLALVTLTLVLVYYSLRGLVIRPLRRFAKQLEGSTTVEEALNVTLDESARNEVGVLAHWQNERTRQLADALSATRTVRAQLSNESGERKQLQELLARSQERATLALQSVTEAVVITDEQGLVEDMNPAAETLTGVALRQARGRALEDVLKTHLPEKNTPAPNFARIVGERGTRLDYPDELVLTSVSGQQHKVVLTAAPLHARGRIAGVVVVFRERGAPGTTTIRLAADGPSRFSRDFVTGLPTRAACERRLDALLDQTRLAGTSAALIFLDLDRMRRVNEFGGQAAGDDVLVRTAETLAGGAPQSQDVYRLAADQFAVIAENVLEQSGVAIAEELRARLAGTRFYWESRYFSVTASFGVCPITADSPSALEVIRRADDACAAAKRAGRNNVQLYDPRMDRVGRIVDDGAWVRCIRRGLEDNLFHLRTQWILPSAEYAGEGHAFEVLLALEDEEGFWASPAAFIPVAERHHVMAEIDRWVIANTLSHLEAHPQTAKTLAFCGINLSTLTLTDPSFLEFMVGQLENRVALAGKLCFEVREQSLTEHPQEALASCDALHKMGCKIAVDHYLGRYMSDLTLLRRLPVDYVKVDALSYKNLSSDPVEQMLAESTLRIARHLRRRVVVTGIEDPRAQETWRKLGASYFQGFAFAKPSPVIFLPPD